VLDWLLTPVNIKIKIINIMVLKPSSKIDRSHWSGGLTRVELVNTRIKMIIIIIIIVLKQHSRVHPRQCPSYKPRESTRVNPGQNKNKNSYYYSFKIWLDDRPEARVKENQLELTYLLKKNQSKLVLTKKISTYFFICVFSRVFKSVRFG
jgi:hypothetical protein